MAKINQNSRCSCSRLAKTTKRSPCFEQKWSFLPWSVELDSNRVLSGVSSQCAGYHRPPGPEASHFTLNRHQMTSNRNPRTERRKSLFPLRNSCLSPQKRGRGVRTRCHRDISLISLRGPAYCRHQPSKPFVFHASQFCHFAPPRNSHLIHLNVSREGWNHHVGRADKGTNHRGLQAAAAPCCQQGQFCSGRCLCLQTNELSTSTLISYHFRQMCFDCKSTNPSWASIPHGIYLCLQCSGVHRNLGVHLSFVRSTQVTAALDAPTLRWLQSSWSLVVLLICLCAENRLLCGLQTASAASSLYKCKTPRLVS